MSQKLAKDFLKTNFGDVAGVESENSIMWVNKQ